jgi:hypothetical protein
MYLQAIGIEYDVNQRVRPKVCTVWVKDEEIRVYETVGVHVRPETRRKRASYVLVHILYTPISPFPDSQLLFSAH